MTDEKIDKIFTEDIINRLFSENIADQFFDALYGDVSEGAYNIKLVFKQHSDNVLMFEFHLTERPGKCMACNLTYGLPQVFSRHPVIDVKGLVQKIDEQLDGMATCTEWKLGATREVSRELHVIPLNISLDKAS